MSIIDERAPLDQQISEIHRLIDSIGGRLDKIVAALDALPAPACTGQRYDVNPDAPEEGTDVRHDTPCPVHVDLGWATRGNTAVLTTMPVAEVPVDGSVEVRPVGGQGRFGPWVHVIGEQERAVGGEENRSLLIDGVPEPFTWHRDMCVQVRPFRPADEDLADARHRARNGGL